MGLCEKINVVLAVALVLGCGGDKSSSIGNSLPHDPVLVKEKHPKEQTQTSHNGIILVAGDSLAVGMSDKFRSLISSCGYRPVIHAVVGTSSIQWSSWIKLDIEQHRPDLVLLSLGTNDALIFDNVLRHRSHKLIADIFDVSSTRYVWILPHVVDNIRLRNISSVRDSIEKISRYSYDSTILNLKTGRDGIHLGPESYSRWACEVWDWTRKMGFVRCDTTSSCIK